MKKLVSLLIALAMLLSVAAFAEPAADTTEAEGSSAVYATATFGQKFETYIGNGCAFNLTIYKYVIHNLIRWYG